MLTPRKSPSGGRSSNSWPAILRRLAKWPATYPPRLKWPATHLPGPSATAPAPPLLRHARHGLRHCFRHGFCHGFRHSQGGTATLLIGQGRRPSPKAEGQGAWSAARPVGAPLVHRAPVELEERRPGRLRAEGLTSRLADRARRWPTASWPGVLTAGVPKHRPPGAKVPRGQPPAANGKRQTANGRPPGARGPRAGETGGPEGFGA